jgi:hypothetical protein
MPGLCTDRLFFLAVTMKTIKFTSANHKFLNGYVCFALGIVCYQLLNPRAGVPKLVCTETL